MGKVVAAYARVSTERQAERQTIEQQLASLRAYAAERAWGLEEGHIYRDDGWSGARLDRPGLDRLRDAAARAAIDLVLVTSPDRLARRYAYQVWLLEEFARAGCEVVFLERPPTDDPQDALLVQIRGAVAEYERTVIADRTRRGRLAALQAGRLLPWGTPPYGYRADPEAARDPARLAVAAEQAAVVRQIFAWYVEEGLPLRAIARRLTATGVPTATGLARWDPSTVGGILRNASYHGIAYGNREQRSPAQRRYPLSAREPRRTGGVTARARPAATWIGVPVPALVTPEMFAAAQTRLARNQAWSPRSTRGEYLLRRLVSCRRCGAAACVSSNGRYAYYRCTTQVATGDAGAPTRCQAHAIPTADLDAAVWSDLQRLLVDPAILAEAARRAQDGWLDESARAMRQRELQARRGTLERQRQRLIDAYAAEAVTLAELQTRVRALEARLADIAHEEQQLASSAEHAVQVAAVAAQLDVFRAAISQGLDHASFGRRRELVELLVDRVLVDQPEVEIRYVIPFGGVAHRKVGLRLCHRGATCRQGVAAGGAAHWRSPGRTCGTTAGSSRRSRSRRARRAAPPRRDS
jgi:site-specific DNA recombinase